MYQELTTMTDETPNSGGISRRDVLRRGAIVGGVVWSVPIVQSLGSPAFAAVGSEAQENFPGDISYVTLFLTCEGIKYAVKYQSTDTGYSPVCWNGDAGTSPNGNGNNVISSDDPGCKTLFDLYSPGTVAGCPPGGAPAASSNAGGDLIVNLGACTLNNYIVHDGDLGPDKCRGVGELPGGWGAPTTPQSGGNVMFTKPE
jgi:hypothetical protein